MKIKNNYKVSVSNEIHWLNPLYKEHPTGPLKFHILASKYYAIYVLQKKLNYSLLLFFFLLLLKGGIGSSLLWF